MKKNKLTFKKSLFNVRLNNCSIFVYTNKENEIILKLEDEDYTVLKTRVFENQEKFQNWFDREINDYDVYQNEAQALTDAINAM